MARKHADFAKNDLFEVIIIIRAVSRKAMYSVSRIVFCSLLWKVFRPWKKLLFGKRLWILYEP